MNIGFIVHDVFLGGGERILNMLMNSFRKEGHQIIIYSWNKEWEQVNLPDGYQQITLNPYPRVGNKFKAFKAFSNALIQTSPDCIITFHLALAEVAIWAAKINHIPFIMSERCDPIYVPDIWYHRIFRNIVYRYCDGLVFQTEKVKDYFSTKIQKHSIVIPNPLIDDNLPIAEPCSSNKEIVAIGRLSHQKNFSVLIEAFSELETSDYTLKIYGEGPLRKELELKISDYYLQDRVLLMGKVHRVVDEIKHSDIFVLSSIHEGMPNVLIESMAMGLACVAFDVPSHGVRDLIQDGVNGFIIPVNDKELLKERLQYLMHDSEEKVLLKKNALEIRKTNSQERIIPLWIQYIKDIISKY